MIYTVGGMQTGIVPAGTPYSSEPGGKSLPGQVIRADTRFFLTAWFGKYVALDGSYRANGDEADAVRVGARLGRDGQAAGADLHHWPDRAGPAMTVGQWDVFKAHFDISGYTPVNPNDYVEINVRARFTDPIDGLDALSVPCVFNPNRAPSGGTGTTPESYSATDSGHWRVSYKPRRTGAWSFQVLVTVAGQTYTSDVVPFTVTGAHAKNGPLTVTSNGYLLASDGSPFYPIGINYAFEDRHGKSTAYDGLPGFQHFMPRMAAGHMNTVRHWLHPYSRDGLQWKKGAAVWGGFPNLYSGKLGDYSPEGVQRTLEFLTTAKANGLKTILTLFEMNEVNSYDGGGQWANSLFNAANGGPIPSSTPQAFWTNSAAKAEVKRYLRFCIALFAPYDIFAWEFMNEMGSTGTSTVNGYNDAATRTAMRAWMDEMGAFIQQNDEWQHPIIASQDWPPQVLGQAAGTHFDNMWQSAYLAAIQTHNYHDSSWSVNGDRGTTRQLILDGKRRLHKPFWLGEYGLYRPSGRAPEPDFDPTSSTLTQTQQQHILVGTHFHEEAWVQALSGGFALSWWWGSMQDDAVKHRTSGTLPNGVTWDFSTRYSLYGPALAAYLAGEDMNAMSPTPADVPCSVSGNIRLVAWGNASKVFIFAKDADDAYDSGKSPGNVANRTVSGSKIYVPGLSGSYTVERWSCYGSGGLLSTSTIAAVNGTLTIAPPAIDRSVAYKVYH